MGEFYSKYKKVFFWITIANVLIALLQLGFAYNHFTKHEWWGLGISLFFGSINAWCAVSQYRNWQRVKREEKEFMWTTLSTPSEGLR